MCSTAIIINVAVDSTRYVGGTYCGGLTDYTATQFNINNFLWLNNVHVMTAYDIIVANIKFCYVIHNITQLCDIY